MMLVSDSLSERGFEVTGTAGDLRRFMPVGSISKRLIRVRLGMTGSGFGSCSGVGNGIESQSVVHNVPS